MTRFHEKICVRTEFILFTSVSANSSSRAHALGNFSRQITAVVFIANVIVVFNKVPKVSNFHYA